LTSAWGRKKVGRKKNAGEGGVCAVELWAQKKNVCLQRARKISLWGIRARKDKEWRRPRGKRPEGPLRKLENQGRGPLFGNNREPKKIVPTLKRGKGGKSAAL